jgi:RimJ/RimL family protein N-acetyltransferase
MSTTTPNPAQTPAQGRVPAQGHLAALATPLPASEIEAKPTRPLVPARPATRIVEVLAPDAWRTSRLLIRAMLPADADQLVPLLAANRDYLAQGLNVHAEGETDAACFERLLASSREGEATGLCVRRVCSLHDGTLVGMVHLLGMQIGLTPRADAGWWIASQFAGNGLASEAVTALVTYALADRPKGMGMLHIEAALTQTNTASQRAAAAAGFTKLPGVHSSIRLGPRWTQHEIWRAT